MTIDRPTPAHEIVAAIGAFPGLLSASWIIDGGPWHEVAADEWLAAADRERVALHQYVVDNPNGSANACREVYLWAGPDQAWGFGSAGSLGRRANGFRSRLVPEGVVATLATGRGTVRYYIARTSGGA